MIDDVLTIPPDDAPPAPARPAYEPVVLAFSCNWCSYRAADLAGTARVRYPSNIRLVRLMCSGRLDPTFVMKAFACGADGVVMTGCWPADCHYRVQNVKALRRFELLARVLADLGIEPERFQRFYASAAEGQQLAAAFTRIVEDLRPLGPLGWGRLPEVAFDDDAFVDLAAPAEPEAIPDNGLPEERLPEERLPEEVRS